MSCRGLFDFFFSIGFSSIFLSFIVIVPTLYDQPMSVAREWKEEEPRRTIFPIIYIRYACRSRLFCGLMQQQKRQQQQQPVDDSVDAFIEAGGTRLEAYYCCTLPIKRPPTKRGKRERETERQERKENTPAPKLKTE